LKDFLAQQISDARIMIFGYNADVTFGQSTSDVIDHAKACSAVWWIKETSQRYISAKAYNI